MRLFPLFRAILRDALDADGKKIVNLGAPTQDNDAANKKYVDEHSGGSDVTGKLPMKPLPKYLHALSFDDTYPADAAWLYSQLGPSDLGRCSAVRRGGKLYRNYDWTFDDAAEFVVKVSSSTSRFGSVGVASVGTRLTENDVMSAVNSRYYKCLPGMTLDGINEKGVVCEINVDGGPKTGWHGEGANALHILAAVRWVLDHGETAAQAAQYLAENVMRPTAMNFHFMVADANATYIVENGEAHIVTNSGAVLTNYALYDEVYAGGGKERADLLADGADITAVWFTKAYSQGNTWHSDFESEAQHAAAIDQWAAQGTDKEAHRGKTTSGGNAWWQTVHTTEYDFAAKTMRIAVQEQDDWYTFAVDASSIDAYTKSETDGLLAEKLDGPTDSTLTLTGKSADAKATGDALANKRGIEDMFSPLLPSGRFGIAGFVVGNEPHIKDDGTIDLDSRPLRIDGTTGEAIWSFPNYYTSAIGVLKTEDGWCFSAYMRDLTVDAIEVTKTTHPFIRLKFESSIFLNDQAVYVVFTKLETDEVRKVSINLSDLAVIEGSSGAALQIGNAGTGHDDSTSPYEVTLNCYGLFTIRDQMRPNDRVTFRIPYLMTGMTGDFTLATTDDIPLPVDISGKLDVIRLAPAYSTSTSYAVGAIVSHNGAIYQCVAATSGAWDATKWAERKLSDFFSDSNGLLTNLVNALIDAKVGNVNAVLEAALDGTEAN